MKIKRLNHAVLFVSDVESAVDFYQGVLGLEVISQQGQMAFLRAPQSENHHDLGLFGLGAEASRPARRSVGLYHLAWEVGTIDELAAARETLLAAGAYVGESDHGATKSVYGSDPDGNEFEVMWLVPRSQWGEFDRRAVTRPLDLDAELERYGGS
ncbi:MAG: VOC family protein [Acidimicrobiia bacterium]